MSVPLGIESVGNDSARNLITGLVSATDRHYQDIRKTRRTTESSSNPDICGILRSEMMTSGIVLLSYKRASKPSCAVLTSYPAALSSIARLSRTLCSSSTTRICAFDVLLMSPASGRSKTPNGFAGNAPSFKNSRLYNIEHLEARRDWRPCEGLFRGRWCPKSQWAGVKRLRTMPARHLTDQPQLGGCCTLAEHRRNSYPVRGTS